VPLIELHITGKVFKPAQKCQIIQKLTGASIEGVNMRGVT
jgi:hypothetical protein